MAIPSSGRSCQGLNGKCSWYLPADTKDPLLAVASIVPK